MNRPIPGAYTRLRMWLIECANGMSLWFSLLDDEAAHVAQLATIAHAKTTHATIAVRNKAPRLGCQSSVITYFLPRK